MTTGQVEWLRLWFLNGFMPSNARPSLTFRPSSANHGHLLFTWSQAFESTTDLITLSLLFPPTCHFINSAIRVQLYILRKREIKEKCLNTLTGIVEEFSTNRDLWHLWHSVASSNSFRNKQHPSLHACIELYANPNFINKPFASLNDFGSVLSLGKIVSFNNFNNSSTKLFGTAKVVQHNSIKSVDMRRLEGLPS